MGCALLQPPPVKIVNLGFKHHVLNDASPWQEEGIAKNKSYSTRLRWILIDNLDRSRCGRFEAGDQAQERILSAPVRTGDAQKLPASDVEAERPEFMCGGVSARRRY